MDIPVDLVDEEAGLNEFIDSAAQSFPNDDIGAAPHEAVQPSQQYLEILRQQCQSADEYPKNQSISGIPRYKLDLKYGQLHEQKSRLFNSEGKCSLVFYEFGCKAEGKPTTCYLCSPTKNRKYSTLIIFNRIDFWPVWIDSFVALQSHFGLENNRLKRDPLCRYL